MSKIGTEIRFETQNKSYAFGRIVAEYPRYVILETPFGYRTCVHKADLMREEKDK